MDVAAGTSLVTAGDWRPLAELLEGLASNEAADLAQWYRTAGRTQADQQLKERDSVGNRTIQRLLAFTLATPDEAAASCRWGPTGVSADIPALQACADALIRRGRAWAADFIEVATPRQPSDGFDAELVSVVSAAIAAFDLPAPLTETYLRGWTALIADTHRSVESAREAKREGDSWWYQSPVLMTAGASGAAMPAYELGDDLTLLGCLKATRGASEMLPAALATPDALISWSRFSEPGWQVSPVIAEALGIGLLQRAPLLDAVFAALSRDDRPGHQRVTIEILQGLDPTSDEISARITTIEHILPTVHGSVTKVLVPVVLAADLNDEELLGIGTVILARPEKAQKTTLLRHLASRESAARDESPGRDLRAVTQLASMAADSDDAALAKQARVLLPADPSPSTTAPTAPTSGGSQDAEGSSSPGVRWTHPIEGFHPGLSIHYPATEAGVDQARSDVHAGQEITQEAAILDLIVRLAHQDHDGLTQAVSHWAAHEPFTQTRPVALLERLLSTGDPQLCNAHSFSDWHADSASVQGRYDRPQPEGWEVVLTDQLVMETLQRLGEVSELLSTPSRSDGTLEVAVLAERVARATDYARHDLVQALLRVGPTNPDALALFADLRLPSAAAGPDGVEVICQWIAGGGWQPREISFPDGEPASSEVVLPLPPELATLDGVVEMTRPAIPDAAEGQPEPAAVLGVTPWDVENLAVLISAAGDQFALLYAEQTPTLIGSAGPIGPAVHHHLAGLLAFPRVDVRLSVARDCAHLARQGRLDPVLLAERSVARFEAGELSLSRVGEGWAELASAASMSVVWPAWIAVLDAACVTPKSAGLADLLRLTRENVPLVVAELGTDWVPDSLSRLAQSKGNTKAIVEARALVASVAGQGAA